MAWLEGTKKIIEKTSSTLKWYEQWWCQWSQRGIFLVKVSMLGFVPYPEKRRKQLGNVLHVQLRKGDLLDLY